MNLRETQQEFVTPGRSMREQLRMELEKEEKRRYGVEGWKELLQDKQVLEQLGHGSFILFAPMS